MKAEIHPEYTACKVTCACGSVFETRSTKKAIKVDMIDVEDDQWIPKAVIHDDSEVFEDGHEGTLIIKGDFAEAKGWL